MGTPCRECGEKYDHFIFAECPSCGDYESSASPAGYVTLIDTDGMEIKPGVFLIGQPRPRPDLGPNTMVCLANVLGKLCTVELSLKLLDT